jgi:cytoskeletal protein RodZ
MTKKTRNESILLVIILLVTIFLIYHFFFSSKPANNQPDVTNPAALVPINSNDTTGTTSPAATSSVASSPTVVSGVTSVNSASPASTSAFLPNGAKLDTSVLNSSVYKSLVAPVYPAVNGAKLGVSNPFVDQQALAAAQASAASTKK